MPMGTVYEALFKVEMLDEKQEKKENEDGEGEGQFCQYHQKLVGHFTQDCQDFLDLVQELWMKGELNFAKK